RRASRTLLLSACLSELSELQSFLPLRRHSPARVRSGVVLAANPCDACVAPSHAHMCLVGWRLQEACLGALGCQNVKAVTTAARMRRASVNLPAETRRSVPFRA